MQSVSEEQRMKQDIEEHGEEDSGVYRGLKWSMKRPYSTYWCGYVDFDTSNLPDTHIDGLDSVAHGGLTADCGFDCAHHNDYAPFPGFNGRVCCGIYRDHDYVLKCIHKMIDYILDVHKRD